MLNAPEHVVAEIGELYTTPRSASPHALAASAIGGDLFSQFHRDPADPAGPGGWWILDEPELHFGSDVLVPDLAGWRRDRLPQLPNVAYFTQRVRKMRIYGHERVAHAWLVDPLQKTLEVYRLEAGHWVVVATHAGDERVRAEPFEAVEVHLGRWWLEA